MTLSKVHMGEGGECNFTRVNGRYYISNGGGREEKFKSMGKRKLFIYLYPFTLLLILAGKKISTSMRIS